MSFFCFFCPHGNVRHCRTPHAMWGQFPLMLFPFPSSAVNGFENELPLHFVGATFWNRYAGGMMEIKIRNVEPYAVQKIDELARKQNISRNGYLKKQLESIALMGEIRQIEGRYESLVQSLVEIIKDNTTAYEQILRCLKEGK